MTDPPARERSAIIERAILTGLASGGLVEQIAAILGLSVPALNLVLYELRDQHSARTEAHLVARVLGQVPCVRCGTTPAARYATAAAPARTEVTPESSSGDGCPDCGQLLARTEGCEKCYGCGYTRC